MTLSWAAGHPDKVAAFAVVKIHARRGLTLASPLDYQVIQRTSETAGTLLIRGGLNDPEASLASLQARPCSRTLAPGP